MSDNLLGLIMVAVALIVVIIIFIMIAVKLRKHGGSLTTITFGTTYEFLNKDKREAVEEILDMNINKQKEVQPTDKPKD